MYFILPAHLQGVSKGFYKSSSSDKQILHIGISDSSPFSNNFYSTAAWTIDFRIYFLEEGNNSLPGTSVFRLVNCKNDTSGRT